MENQDIAITGMSGDATLSLEQQGVAIPGLNRDSGLFADQQRTAIQKGNRATDLLTANHLNNSILARDAFCILGLPFDAVNLSETKSLVLSDINNKKRCFLTTANLNFLIAAQSDPSFFQTVVDSDLVIADGMPIIWIAKLLGMPLTERVAGSDLFDALYKQKGHAKKTSVFFFGGNEGIAKRASQKMNKSSQAMSCCGFLNPGFVSVDEMSTPDIIDFINQANPDFLLVSLGAVKGQAWIQQNRGKLNAPIISHLGAVVNFIAGNIERAPIVWRRCSLEWLWRIVQEPVLWKRYFLDGIAFIRLLTFKVFPLAIYNRWLKKSYNLKSPVSISYDISDRFYAVKLSGSVRRHTDLKTVKSKLAEVLQAGPINVELNCSGLLYIDGAFIGSLMLFQRELNQQGRQLYLKNLSKRIIRLLKLYNASGHFQYQRTGNK